MRRQALQTAADDTEANPDAVSQPRQLFSDIMARSAARLQHSTNALLQRLPRVLHERVAQECAQRPAAATCTISINLADAGSIDAACAAIEEQGADWSGADHLQIVAGYLHGRSVRDALLKRVSTLRSVQRLRLQAFIKSDDPESASVFKQLTQALASPALLHLDLTRCEAFMYIADVAHALLHAASFLQTLAIPVALLPQVPSPSGGCAPHLIAMRFLRTITLQQVSAKFVVCLMAQLPKHVEDLAIECLGDDHARCNTADITAKLKKLVCLRSLQLTSMCFNDDTADPKEVAKLWCPALSELRSLRSITIHAHSASPKAPPAGALSPYAVLAIVRCVPAHLTSLKLSNHSVGAKWEVIAKQVLPRLTQLRALTLRGCALQCSDAAWAVLSKLTELQELDVSGNKLTAKAKCKIAVAMGANERLEALAMDD